MTVALFALTVIALYLLNAQERKKQTEAWARERASLLDRIQHPEVRQVEPGETVEYQTPKDEAELAQVGQIVPEFIQVGGDE